MNKVISIALLMFLFTPVYDVSAASSETVDIVAAGYIHHGPMQSTVLAIEDVVSKYCDKVTITWIDLETVEGQNYFQDHGLTAHMNVIVDGKDQYNIDGKDVTFQWFEGNSWTKEDLDAVISSLLNNGGSVSPVEQTEVGQRIFNPFVIFIILGAVGIGGWFVIKKLKK